MKHFLTRITFLLFILEPALSQTFPAADFQKNFKVHIRSTAVPVKIDGLLDDSAWAAADPATDFFLKYPTDKGRPKRNTEVKLAYDAKFLYVSFTCYDTAHSIIQSLKRDIGHLDNDGVGIMIDPLNQHTTGFIFVVNAYNAQSEDQISLSQDNELTWSWDNKWFSATKRYADRWTAEMAIPFKTLRYPPGNILWGINFLRVDMKSNQYSAWTNVPVNFHIYNLGYTGSLIWDAPPPNPGTNMVAIPYLTGGVDQDKENHVPLQGTMNAGLDSKITLTSSLNLDLTLNPDFSQVEVDRQVTNLTRYDIFLPEKRSFFLENADIFGEYGIPALISPFYSRRIGLDKDGNRIPIIGGARLSGNFGSSTRIGVMNMQTGSKGSYSAENYSAFSINQNVLSRSVLKGYFLNRENFQSADQKMADPLNAWGRNAGMSFDFINRPGTWNAWAGYHHSFKPGITKDNQFMETGVGYNGRAFTATLDLASVGTNYYTDMGYVQRLENYDALRDTTIRLGFKHIYTSFTYKLFPATGKVNRYTLNLDNYIVFNPWNTLNERSHSFKYRVEYKNNAMFELGLNHDEVNLIYPITFTDGTPLPPANYHYSQVTADYFSDSRKPFSYNLLVTGGGFYNGNIYTLSGGIVFRHRPHLNIAIQAEYDKISFPEPYGRTELLLISPRIDLNFSTAVSWTTFIQYSTQGNNFNINSRFQYRFKPMSDLYLVYTDNYFTSPLLKNKNRAIVFKLNYWLNL